MNNSKEEDATISHNPQGTSTAQSAASNSGSGNSTRESDNPQRVRTPATLGSTQHIMNSGTVSHAQNINQQINSAAASYGAILDQLSPEFIVSLKQGMSAVFGNDQDTSLGTVSVNGSSTAGNAITNNASGTSHVNTNTSIQQQQQQSNMLHAVHHNPTQNLGQHPASTMNAATTNTSHTSNHRQHQPSSTTGNATSLQNHSAINAAASISSPWVVNQANIGAVHANTPSHVSVPSGNIVAQHILPTPTAMPLTHSNLLQQQQQQQQQNLNHANTALMQFIQPNNPNSAVNNLFNTVHQAFRSNNAANTLPSASTTNSTNNVTQPNVSSTTISTSTNNQSSHPTHVVQPSNSTIQTNISGLFNAQQHVNTIHSTTPLQQMLNITLPNIQSIQGNTMMGWNVQPTQLQPTQPVQHSQFPSLMFPAQTAQKRKANEITSSNKPQEEEYSNTAVSASSSSAGNSGGSNSRNSGNKPKPAKLAKTTQQVQSPPPVAGQQLSSQHQAQQPPFAVSITGTTGHFRQATESPPTNTMEDILLGRGNGNTSTNASPSNVPLSMKGNSKNMSTEQKKRQEKNIREQKRSQQISQQIKELRQVLTESKVPFQKNKYSILMSVVDYIKNLQERATFLDSEHGKLIHTIQQTSEIVNNGMIHHQDEEENVNVGNDADLLYVQGLDYKAIFEQCVFPIGVAALDGRFLTFNQEFGTLAGLNQESTESLTLFGLLQDVDTDEVFRALGSLLKDSDSEGSGTSGNDSNNQQGTSPDPSSADYGNNDEKNGESGSGSNVSRLGDSGDDGDSGFTYSNGYWSGDLSGANQHLRMHISLSRTADGTPKFFNCSLARSVQDYED
ncbi:hypothetical protein CTEN210_10250 [Chaetoceros tenuissimus]|uniref:BHLH domain-containing protein n=1 Tax=Chaetoceros tenuissimus TaxID=426638 RepID=A0AAD3D0A3_9STRA|nr:hypothetical protein CTEN210_10250 [Chaetoceros tenuissimus]